MARILIVDDDVDVRSTVAHLVALDGHEPLTPLSGREAEAVIREGAYDLVITDVIMPEVDGIEIVKLVRSVRVDCPIIAMSGGSRSMSSRTTLHMAGSLGANTTLPKPFSRAELQAAIAALLTSGGP